MRRAFVLLGLVAAVAVVLYFALGSRRASYEGLAGRFPASTELFAETTRIGQWLSLGEEPGGEVSQTPSRSDPLLEVLGQVWAAEPLRPQDLPSLLKNQPLAVGLWRNPAVAPAHGQAEDRAWAGGALLVLGPGQRSSLEKFLDEKLSNSSPAGMMGAMALKRFSPAGNSAHSLYWGVDDSQAIVATSEEAVKALLGTSRDHGLAADRSFKAAIRPLKAKDGALLYVSGELFSEENIASIKKAVAPFLPWHGASWCSAEPEKPEAAPEKPEAKDDKEQGEKQAMGEIVKSLKNLASIKSLAGAAFWTEPPSKGRALWDAAINICFKDKASGVWRLLAEAGSARPLIQERLPRDGAAYFWEGGLDPPRLYRLALEEAGRSLPPSQMGNIRGAIGLLEGKLDLSLANDLLPTIGGEYAAVFGKEGEESRWAAVFALQDPRRFESLVAEKIAKSLSLKAAAYPGARGWTFGGDGGKDGVTLLVSGGAAIVTANPAWALSTGGEAGKAWKKLAALAKPVSGALVFSPEAKDVGAGPTITTWTFSSQGVLVRAEVAGSPLRGSTEEKAGETAGR